MPSRLAGTLFAVGVIGLGSGTMAETLRVGVISTPRLLREAPQSRTMLLRIDQDQAPRRRSIAVLQEELRRKTESLERDGAVMNAANREALEREIREQQRNLKQQQELFDESLAIRRYEDFARLQAELVLEAREIAALAGYDVVLPNALYASPAIDITDLVLRELHARHAAAGRIFPQSDRAWAGAAALPHASLR
ncbi:MAG TPA: OmpH family outer membrane protein [Gammaproteobacteria bacterium]|nr:OmpH family outer membrane protein [Gammaproteobacteria bacterium]